MEVEAPGLGAKLNVQNSHLVANQIIGVTGESNIVYDVAVQLSQLFDLVCKKAKDSLARAFRFMNALMDLQDFLSPDQIKQRAENFDLRESMIVVDYGWGTGRYIECFTRIVKETCKGYAVDIHDLSIRAVNDRIEKHHFRNVDTYLVNGYRSRSPDHVADRVVAIDMFFRVPNAM